MALGWFTDLAAGNAALAAMPGTSSWATLSSAEQTAYLTAAFKRIKYGNLFTIPATPTADQTERLQSAQAETAWYLKLHKTDEDIRMGLQAQGVTEAGIVQEKFLPRDEVPLPRIVFGLLADLKKGRFSILSSQMTRDEESDA